MSTRGVIGSGETDVKESAGDRNRVESSTTGVKGDRRRYETEATCI